MEQGDGSIAGPRRLWRWYGVELIDIIRKKIQDGLQSERPADSEKWNERLANITANDLRPLSRWVADF